MSDATSIVSNFLSVDELLTPQFLYPVCGVILCAVAVFLVGVGFKTSSEPKFQISGDGDGVPFLKKKKKQKSTVGQTVIPKKAQLSASTQSKPVKGRRPDDFFDRETALSAQTSLADRNSSEMVTSAVADEWITPVSRKEKKARRRQEFPLERDSPDRVDAGDVETILASKEPEVLVAAELEVAASPPPQDRRTEKKSHTARHEEPVKGAVAEEIKAPPEKVEKLDDEVRSKKSSKQKQKQTTESPVTTSASKSAPTDAGSKPAPASPARDAATKKKKKGAGLEAVSASGAFKLAEFELPVAAAVPPVQRKSPSPPSTDSSFELVDADAVREAFQEAEEEKQSAPSRTSGASRRKNKKPARPGNGETGDAGITKISEETALPTTAAAAVVTAPEASPPVSEPAEAVSDEWQDAKSTRKRRRPRRDD